jgi:hypothetical protein
MIYLASPYSNDPEGNYAAMLDVCKRLVARAPAPLVFSPVVYFHSYCQQVPYEQVMDMCIGVLKRSTQFAIVDLPGWTESEGVRREAEFWKKYMLGSNLQLMNHKSLLVISQ